MPIIPLTIGALLEFDADWLAGAEADAAMRELRASLDWKQRPIRIMGREILQPRLTAWYGERAYTYSGVTLAPASWTPLLRALRDRLAGQLSVDFNSVLCNLYRDGNDSMGMHADDEPELGKNPVIASVSLGATRRFVLRAKKGSAGDGVDLDLTHGSLLVMAGATQHLYRHGLPKTKSVVGERINLTFRKIVG